MRVTDTHVFFWTGPFSNWHPAKFQMFDIFFYNSEQAFMWLKARYFEDDEVATKILGTSDPKRAKDLGKIVRGYNDSLWTVVRQGRMFEACLAKFSQNPDLKKMLLDTGDRTLVEASPIDKVWGIGMGEDDPGVEDELNWKGQNLLGNVLMDVRDNLTQ